MSEYRGIELIHDFDRKSWNKRSGWSIGRPFRGSQVKIEQAMQAALLAGDSFDMRPGVDGAPWEIEILFGSEDTQPTGEPLSDEWERLENEIEKELWFLPLVRDGMLAISDNAIRLFGEEDGHDYIHWLKRTLDLYFGGENSQSQKDYKTLAGDTFPITFAKIVDNLTQVGVTKEAAADWISRISRLYARGYKAFFVSTFALRRTRVLASNFDFTNISEIDNDLLKVRTTNSLISAYGVPTRFSKIMPPGEWLKKVATVGTRGPTKDQCVEEWWHADLWEREIYGDPI
jgi:hypothetical protein